MLEAKFSLLARLRQARARLRYVKNYTVPFPNMTAVFPEDDNLFMDELFRYFHLNFGYDLARSVTGEVCSEMHSSRGSSRLPKIHPQYLASWANPQDQPAEPTLRLSQRVPVPGQLALCGGLDTIGVNWRRFFKKWISS